MSSPSRQSGMHPRAISADASGDCWSCPGGQKFVHQLWSVSSAPPLPGRQGRSGTQRGAATRASGCCGSSWPGRQIGTQAGAGVGPGSASCAFVSGCGSWPGRQIGVQPGSVGGASARARGSAPRSGMQICGCSAGGDSGGGLSGAQAARARPPMASTPTNMRRPARLRTILPMVPPVGSWIGSRQDHPRPLSSGIGTPRRHLERERRRGRHAESGPSPGQMPISSDPVTEGRKGRAPTCGVFSRRSQFRE